MSEIFLQQSLHSCSDLLFQRAFYLYSQPKCRQKEKKKKKIRDLPLTTRHRYYHTSTLIISAIIHNPQHHAIHHFDRQALRCHMVAKRKDIRRIIDKPCTLFCRRSNSCLNYLLLKNLTHPPVECH